jgi:hypothetical protein
MRLLSRPARGGALDQPVLLALLIITPLAQIVMRGIFNVPMAGAEELARYFLITLTFLSASYVTQQGGQIRMEEFQGLIPPRPRWWLQLGIDLAGMRDVRCALRRWTDHHSQESGQPDGDAGNAVLAIHGPLALGAALLVVETTAAMLHTWRRKRPEEKHTVLS